MRKTQEQRHQRPQRAHRDLQRHLQRHLKGGIVCRLLLMLCAPLCVNALQFSSLGCFFGGVLWAQEHVITQPLKSVEIDGRFHDWRVRRGASFEHHARYALASRADVRGEVRVAITSATLYVMMEAYDDDLHLGRGAQDHARLILASGNHEGRVTSQWRREFILDLKPLTQQRAPRVLRGRRPVKGARAAGRVWWGEEPQGLALKGGSKAKGASAGRGGWRVELSLPLTELPPLLGQRIGLMGALFDVDERDLSSVYTTELSNASLTPLRAGWVLGGNGAFRAMFESLQRTKIQPLKALDVDWVGDARPESIYITPSEVIILGADLPLSSTYARVSHGWRGEVSIEEVELKGVRGHKQLMLTHTQERVVEGRALRERVVELYTLTERGLERVFAQVTELKWGEGRAGLTLNISPQGALSLSRVRREGLTRAQLSSLPVLRARTPLMGLDGRGRAHRLKFHGGRWVLRRE